MKKNNLIILSIVIILGLAISAWYIFIRQKNDNCSRINSLQEAEKCVGQKITAVGILECQRVGVIPKAGVHYLKFPDGTETKTLEEINNCKDFDGKEVKIVGEFYQCGQLDQCIGNGLRNIEAIL